MLTASLAALLPSLVSSFVNLRFDVFYRNDHESSVSHICRLSRTCRDVFSTAHSDMGGTPEDSGKTDALVYGTEPSPEEKGDVPPPHPTGLEVHESEERKA